MTNNLTIEQIASQHLGKAGDGTIVKPYVTPDTIDPSLLVAVPRSLNRTAYDIDETTVMKGYDVWHAYEFSFLLDNGFPVSGMLKIAYPSDSFAIVESKSLKLYLNSFNMHKFSGSAHAAVYAAADRVCVDLSNLLNTKVETWFHAPYIDHVVEAEPFDYKFTPLEQIVNINDVKFTHYNESPDIIQLIETGNMREVPLAVCSSSLRSNCRVTNQPDWGDVFVYIKGKYIPTPESLLQYIVSMRRENHFHEEIAECVYKRLLDLAKPDELLVACLYTRRGGIDINPIRYNKHKLGDLAAGLLTVTYTTKKTQRQ